MPGRVARQSSQGLLAGPSDANEHGAATLLLDRAVDLHHVHHGLVEQDQVHRLGWVLLVVPVPVEVRLLLHEVPRVGGLVDLGGTDRLAGLLVILDLALEVAEPGGLLVGLSQLLSEVLWHELSQHLVDMHFVHLPGQLVGEDPDALVLPEADEDGLVLDDVNRTVHHALEHAAQIPHVEDVVEAHGCGKQRALDLVPHIHRCRTQLLGELDDGWLRPGLGGELHLHDATEDHVD
mmetsp:Transcript_78729/g.197789  ORF Transcript_78729/g.197789 Transcript_78729/m.197789 type:complete len:235 (-) Transcript_78729:2334-3038(-)